MLLENGSQVEIQTRYIEGRMGLCFDAADGQFDLVRERVSAGAGVDADTDSLNSPVCIAANYGFTYSLMTLIRHNAKMKHRELECYQLAPAIRSGINNAVILLQLLMDNDELINASNRMNETPLMRLRLWDGLSV